MIPEIIEVRKQGMRFFWIMSNEVVGISYEVSQFDSEVENLERLQLNLSEYFKNISEKVQVRLQVLVEPRSEEEFSHARVDAIKELTFWKRRVFVHFEFLPTYGIKFFKALFTDKNFEAEITKLNELIDLSGFEYFKETPRNLNEDAIRDLVKLPEFEAMKFSTFLDFGHYVVGVLRLCKLSTHELDMRTTSEVLDGLIPPFEISVTIKKVGSQRAENFLRRKSKQELTGEDLSLIHI